ncbi:MAG TPA: cysteine desulfurase family protein [Nitrososphaeraceae archaeon]|jgi:cysteine desulfurase|nr:cysteine desulfurase family protein [Nitrososphaeraceae archaeon]
MTNLIKNKSNSHLIYLDHAASTPVLQEIINEMIPYLGDLYGNPSSIHTYGIKSKIAIQTARRRVAFLIGAKPSEIFFTSGGTESDNLALKGISKSIRNYQNKKNHIITSSIEHDAILETCHYLEKDGFNVTYLNVDKNGIIDKTELKNQLTEKTALVSIMLANNEIGVIQPVKEFSKIVHDFDKRIIFHSDAVQAVGKIPVNVKELDLDSLSLSSHKINGPKGVGALYVREKVNLEPLMQGGGQELTFRSGTENVPGIVGFGKASEISMLNLKNNSQYLYYLRDYFINRINEEISGRMLNGSLESRLPNNVNFTFLGINGEDLLIKLDEDGILASTGSACSANLQQESHVLKAIGLNHEEISGSIRFTLGVQNTKEEIEKTIITLNHRIIELRKFSPRQYRYKK